MADEFDDKDIKTTLNAWRESVDRNAGRKEWFWARQRARIAARMQQGHARRMPAVAWAGIAATVVIAVALVVPGDKSTSSHPTVASNAPVPVEAQMSDHDLMQQLQETMNENVPDALQPGSKLAQAMENAYSSTTVSKAKESTQ